MTANFMNNSLQEIMPVKSLKSGAVTLCHLSRNLQCNSDSGRCYVNGSREKTQVWSCVKNFSSSSVVIHLLKAIVDKVDNC